MCEKADEGEPAGCVRTGARVVMRRRPEKEQKIAVLGRVWVGRYTPLYPVPSTVLVCTVQVYVLVVPSMR